MSLKEFFRRFFIVHRCGGCREILDGKDFDAALCPECSLRFRVAKTESCPVCSQSAVDCLCMPKELVKSGALCLRKLYFYDSKREKEPQNKLVYFLKKKPNRRVASFVASELAVIMNTELDTLGADAENTVLVNVPRGHGSRRVYGFDQSAFMCAELSAVSGIPYAAAIRRRHGGKEQKQLTRAKRFSNVKSLFSAADAEAVKERYVVLYDDVVTTGASMSACVEVLKKSGARGVICLSMAQVKKK